MRAAAFVYLVLVHALVGWLLWRQLHPHVQVDERAALIASGVRRAAQVPTAIAIIGDSRVADLATSTVGPNVEGYGIGSEPLEQVRERIPLYRLERAPTIVVESGIKEWHERRFEGFAGRYRSMLSALPAGVPVIAMALFPLDESRVGPRWQGVNAALPAANAAIEAACKARLRCVFAPHPFGPTLQPRHHNGDGLHLSPEGSALMAATIRAALVRQAVA